jgi:hypothetical protein
MGLKEKPLGASGVADRVVRVQVPANVLYNFNQVTKVMKGVLGKLGCQACCSGHDIRFEIERNFIADKGLNVRATK